MSGLTVGIVGVGSFGREFIPLFLNHPLVDRVAACDLDPCSLAVARDLGVIETYETIGDLLSSDIQAIALFTQPWLHAPQAISAMEKGKHVYSAVPVVELDSGDLMLEWCDHLIETCKRTGMRYMMGETSYYRPEAMYCRRLAVEGLFGDFVLAEGHYFHDIDDPGCSLRDVARRRWGADWSPARTGGIPMHYCTHSIGGLLSVLNAPLTEVSAIGYELQGDDYFRADTSSGNVYSNETALFRCANGASVRIAEYRRIGHYGEELFELYGTRASFRHGVNGAYIVDRKGARQVHTDEMRDPLSPEVLRAYRAGMPTRTDVYGGHGGSHAYLVDEFITAIVCGRQPVINAWTAARYFAPGVVAHQSAMRGGELMKIPDWGDPPVEHTPAPDGYSPGTLQIAGQNFHHGD